MWKHAKNPIPLTLAPLAPPPGSSSDEESSIRPRLFRQGDLATTTVEGRIVRAEGARVWLGPHPLLAPLSGKGDASAAPIQMGETLEAVLDLSPLVGEDARVTTVVEGGPGEAIAVTRVVSDDDGRALLIARTGAVRGACHTLSRAGSRPALQAALSQRPDGPLVVGTATLQWLVHVGELAVIHTHDGSVFRAVLVERRPDGSASYVIGEDRLFR